MHGNFLAVHHAAGAHGQHFGRLGLFLGGAGQHDAALGGFFHFNILNDHTVAQRLHDHNLKPPVFDPVWYC